MYSTLKYFNFEELLVLLLIKKKKIYEKFHIKTIKHNVSKNIHVSKIAPYFNR
jgi:hypothetical protein